MLTLSVIFLTLDFYYACWIYQLRHKFPHYISDYLSKALYGFTTQMIGVLKQNLKGLPENMRKGRDQIGEDVLKLRGRRRNNDNR